VAQAVDAHPQFRLWMTNPRLPCEPTLETMHANNAKGNSGLKELLAQLTGTVEQIAREVE